MNWKTIWAKFKSFPLWGRIITAIIAAIVAVLLSVLNVGCVTTHKIKQSFTDPNTGNLISIEYEQTGGLRRSDSSIPQSF